MLLLLIIVLILLCVGVPSFGYRSWGWAGPIPGVLSLIVFIILLVLLFRALGVSL